MNRRQFTQRITALAAVPLMPAGMVTKAAATATPVAANSNHHMWATFIARVHDKASPEMIKRTLSISNEQAEGVFRDLVRDKILSTPNSAGVSHAMNPFKREFSAGLSSPQSAFQPKPESALKERAEKLMEPESNEDTQQISDDSDTVNHHTPECSDEPDTNIDPDVTNSENPA
jgi:hypothetical protein